MTANSTGSGVDFGDFQRRAPLSRDSADRGMPVERYYVDQFLARHASDIRGRVLEVGGDSYTRQLGGDRVTSPHTLTIRPGAVADPLSDLSTCDAGQFDCVLLPQTLHLVYDIGATIRRLHSILAPDGVILATLPGLSRLAMDDDTAPQCWGFTSRSARGTFEEVFVPESVSVSAHGNVLAAIALMQGLAASELTTTELDHVDPAYEVILGIRAIRHSARAQDDGE